MDSWWNLGEWLGNMGTTLAIDSIECPFCEEIGNFSIEHHVEKKQPNGRKVLNFDTLKCGNCASFVLVFWSAGDTLHSYRMVPWPLKLNHFPKHWPEAVGRYWLQAKRNLRDQNWDAAVLMARSALQISLREKKAEGKNLKQEIDDLANKGVLPNIMKDWAHNVRELGNESAHPDPQKGPTNSENARDIVGFVDYLFEYLYTLPYKITEYRKRQNP